MRLPVPGSMTTAARVPRSVAILSSPLPRLDAGKLELLKSSGAGERYPANHDTCTTPSHGIDRVGHGGNIALPINGHDGVGVFWGAVRSWNRDLAEQRCQRPGISLSKLRLRRNINAIGRRELENGVAEPQGKADDVSDVSERLEGFRVLPIRALLLEMQGFGHGGD